MIWIIGLFISYVYESNNSWVEPLIGYHIADTAVTTICHLLVSFTKLRYYVTSIHLEIAFIFFSFQQVFPFIISVHISLSCWHLFSADIIPLPCKPLLCLYPVSKVQVVLLLFHYTQNRMLCAIAHHSTSRPTAQSKASLETFEYSFC